jgi:peptide/nickel transport system ATP-binding protein
LSFHKNLLIDILTNFLEARDKEFLLQEHWLPNQGLLVCDEPTSALDVSIQAQILNLLKDLQEQLNLTILFISHDLPVVRQMCDRIGVLKDGKLCEVANTEEIFLKPQHDYTKKLLHLMPKIESIYN